MKEQLLTFNQTIILPIITTLWVGLSILLPISYFIDVFFNTSLIFVLVTSISYTFLMWVVSASINMINNKSIFFINNLEPTEKKPCKTCKKK